MTDEIIEDSITMTSKGTFTLPVKIRRLLGLSEMGARLKIRFYADKQEAVIYKPVEFSEVQEMSSKYLSKRKPPLTDVSGFYQKRGKK